MLFIWFKLGLLSKKLSLLYAVAAFLYIYGSLRTVRGFSMDFPQKYNTLCG